MSITLWMWVETKRDRRTCDCSVAGANVPLHLVNVSTLYTSERAGKTEGRVHGDAFERREWAGEVVDWLATTKAGACFFRRAGRSGS